MKKNVLIFGGGSYAASQVYFSLKDTVRYKPILASSSDNHSTFICKDSIIDLPYDSAPNFIEELNKCIEQLKIDFIIPTHDTAALVLAKNQSQINATVVCSQYETALACRYKSIAYEKLKEFDFVPKVYKTKDEITQFPVFAKDDVGQGGRNAIKIESISDFEKLQNNIDYVICEYLPGEEITIDCFTDKNGEIIFAQPRRRSRLLNGISARGYLADMTDEIMLILKSISSVFSFRGYWFVQCKQDVFGKYKLMEISTRFAGTFCLSKNLDVNLPLLAVSDFDNLEVNAFPNNIKIISDKSYIDRYKLDYEYNRVYIDFDDTIVFDRRKYNTLAMRYLYQCINEGKEIILITKHKYDLCETAKKIRLNLELFDNIIEVPIDTPKYVYMDNKKNSIFIDNAFNERKLVKEKLGMPTFDVANIECLIDWRLE